MQEKKKPTIQVQRRRKGGEETLGTTPRAEAPQRQRETGGAARPPTSRPTGTPTSGGSTRLPWWMAILVVIFFIGIKLFGGGEVDVSEEGDYSQPAQYGESQPVGEALPQVAAPTSTRRPTSTPGAAAAAGGQTWLVMLYQDADDKILEQDIYLDLNEAERVGSSANMHIVAQVDRYRGGYSGDGDWTSARRYYVTKDQDLNRVNSELIADLGEVNMADAATLVDFATWAISTYPADKYVLILSDHGMGWPGGWSDSDPKARGDSRLPLSSVLGDQLYLVEIDQALGEIRSQAGIDKFELVGMDACLMGHIEVFAALEPHARYAVASQEVEPALGWAYSGFLTSLKINPAMDGAELASLIVESYIDQDQRIQDDQARMDFLRQGSPLGSLFGAPSAADISRQLSRDITLTAADLSKLPDLLAQLDALAYAFQSADQRGIAQARTYAQSFTSVFGQDVPASYVDLSNLAQLAARQVGGEVTNAARYLVSAVSQVVIAEKHGARRPGATGISIYFPNSQLYASSAAGAQSYTATAPRFAESSLWDEFLAFHYSGRSFQMDQTGVTALPASGVTRAPGAGRVEITNLSLSSSQAAPGQPVEISADINGDSVGYLKLFVGYYDPNANSIFVADSDYLESSDTRDLNGVYYPVWPGEEFTVAFSWDPIIFSISDGVNLVPALFTPRTYGASFEDAIYSVDGIYTFVATGEQRYARLLFRNGVLIQVLGFTGQVGVDGGTGAPSELLPDVGDTFTVLETWLDLDSSQNVTQSTQPGGSLTFSDQVFTWQQQYAAAGEYLVGFIVEDLDGNAVQSFAQVSVK